MQKQIHLSPLAATTIAVVLLGVLSSPFRAPAQIIKFTLGQKPRVPVTLHHPAGMGIALQGKKVAFGQISGPCAQQFSDLLISAFQENGVEVINREHLSAVLAEHRFQVSSSVDPTTAVKLGKVLGPSVMIFIGVSRCNVERNVLREDQFVGPPVNVSRTQGHFLASLHAVDLATGREIAVRSIETNPRRENRSATGIPEYPGEVEVEDQAVHEAVTRSQHLFFSWTETRTVPFMNSKECNLKAAYDLLKAGDAEGALKLSRENVQTCKSDPKPAHQADAWYNLGVCYALVDDYDQALAAMAEANRIHSDKTILETIAGIRQEKANAEALKRAGEQQAADADKASGEDKRRTEQQAKATLTNDSIIKMVKSHLPAEVIVRAIASQPAKFAVLPEDLIALKEADVPDAVITAMLDKR